MLFGNFNPGLKSWANKYNIYMGFNPFIFFINLNIAKRIAKLF